jgi:hypothetical protein
MPTEDATGEPTDGPTDQEVVETASAAAEGVVNSYYSQSDLKDLDITVTFEDGVLDVDVYLNPVADADPDAEAVADEAALAAQAAVDDLFDAA